MTVQPTFDLVDAWPSSAVAAGGTILFPYPTGRNYRSYDEASASLSVPGFQSIYTVASGAITISLTTIGALVTLVSVPPIPAGARATLGLEVDLPVASEPATVGDATEVAASDGRIVLFDGDSLIENPLLATLSTAQRYSYRGLSGALAAVTMRRIDTRLDLNLGQSAANSTTILTHLPRVLASDADIVFCPTSSNDFLASATPANLATFKANWTSYWKQVLAAGKEMWTTPPYAKEQTTKQARDLQLEASQWVLSQANCYENFKVFDVNYLWGDSADASNSPKSGYAIDTNPKLHPGNLGMLSSILPIRDYVNARFPLPAPRMQSVADRFHPANNRTGNLLANGLLSGTGGGSTSSSSTVTGSIANSMDLHTFAPSGSLASLTCVASKTTTADGRPRQTVTLGGSFTGDASTGSFVRLRELAVDVSQFAIGDLVYAECDVEMDAAAIQCLSGFVLLARATVSGTQQQAVDGYATPTDVLPSFAQTFRLRTSVFRRDGVTPSLNLTAVPTLADLNLAAFLRPGAQDLLSGNVVFHISNMNLRKVIL